MGRGETEQRAHPSPEGPGAGAPSGDGCPVPPFTDDPYDGLGGDAYVSGGAYGGDAYGSGGAYGVEPGASREAGRVERFADPASPEGARLTACLESVAQAQRLTVAALERLGLGRFRDTADRLVAELATNAVKHTGGRYFGLHLTRRGGWLRVEVRDSSRALPCLISSGDPAGPGGGLALVEKLADRWGADLLPRGKGVWFELRLR